MFPCVQAIFLSCDVDLKTIILGILCPSELIRRHDMLFPYLAFFLCPFKSEANK